MKNYWTRVSYLMLKIKYTVTRYRPLIAIGYKYKTWKVITFIAKYYAEITNYGINYLSRYPKPFANFSILHVSHPIVIYKLF